MTYRKNGGGLVGEEGNEIRLRYEIERKETNKIYEH